MVAPNSGPGLEELNLQAEQEIAAADSAVALEEVRVRYLGKKGSITEQLKRIGSLPAHERRDFGRDVNQSKARVARELEQKRTALEARARSRQIASENLDVTQPGRRQSLGSIHPVTRTFRRMERIFDRVGFDVASGPEIEDDYHNFEALNIPADHPARAMHDTFYIDGHTVLRTHTSPVQVRYMNGHAPPIRVIAPGKVYRCDSDVTHTPMFHQLEGLAIDREVTFADLKGILIHFIHEFFEKELPVRFRPSYFPFTEPSAEVDMGCVFCNGQGCRICKHTGWLEVLGCGMVHPDVLRHGGIDSTRYSGYAFGMGVERMTMLRYSINDLRLFFGNELSFLRQF